MKKKKREIYSDFTKKLIYATALALLLSMGFFIMTLGIMPVSMWGSEEWYNAVNKNNMLVMFVCLMAIITQVSMIIDNIRR